LLQVVALANLLPPDSNTDELDSYMYQTVSTMQQELLLLLMMSSQPPAHLLYTCRCCTAVHILEPSILATSLQPDILVQIMHVSTAC
jgi:hypothetical protein